MIFNKMQCYGVTLLLTGILAGSGFLRAADATSADDIATLKAQIAEQQKQLESLQLSIAPTGGRRSPSACWRSHRPRRDSQTVWCTTTDRSSCSTRGSGAPR